MSDTRFTPGPYRVGADMESICLNRGTDDDYTSNGWAKKLATVHWKQSWMSAEESFANAHLISAAPELYEALEGLLSDIEEYQKINNLGGKNNHWQVISRAALAKARGEV